MESVVVREIEDLSHVSENTSEIEFVQFDLDVLEREYLKNLGLRSVTFTKMDVDLEDLSFAICELSFYDCSIYHYELLNKFSNLTVLEITNHKVDCSSLVDMQNLKSLNVNYSEVSHCVVLEQLACLEEVSIIGSVFDFSVLSCLRHLKVLVIDEDILEQHREVIKELSLRGVCIMDMMGGHYHVL